MFNRDYTEFKDFCVNVLGINDLDIVTKAYEKSLNDEFILNIKEYKIISSILDAYNSYNK